MEDRLRRSALLWRSVAGAALVLGVIGSIIIAVAAARGPYGDEFDALVFVAFLVPSVFVLTLLLGFLFMGTQMMEGLAELIGIGYAGGSSRQAGSLPLSRTIHRHVKEPGAALFSQVGGRDFTWLSSGTEVVELLRRGRAVKVSAPDGVSGWLRDSEIF